MSSMIELVKKISSTGQNQELVCNREEYGLLIKELHSIDKFLQSKYLSYESVPQVFSLFGVKISVV